MIPTENKYPEAFISRMNKLLGNESEDFLKSLDTSSPVSVRINPYKPTTQFDNEESVTWCTRGKYLAERPSFTFDPLFHAGTYYVQEASSMFVEQVWNQIMENETATSKALNVLDMCAAPGGKSTHLLSLMNAHSLLVSNEVIPGRNNILQQNIVKWGTANCVVTQNIPIDFAKLENFFDVILIDAPCSGEGMFRKDKNAIAEWSEQNVEMCAVRQKDILQNAVACLKPGGYIIYSTCTFELIENDLQIAGSGLTAVPIKTENFGQQRMEYGYQFYPHQIKGEGFYIALLKKAGDWTPGNNRPDSSSAKQVNPIALKYLQQPEGFNIFQKKDFLFAMPQSLFSDFRYLERFLYVRHAGVYLGTTKGKDFLPAHDLALSIHLQNDLPSIELTYNEAIAFLRCETPRIQSDLRGWCLATYQGQRLGWMKMMEGRFNNYMPKELRILKQSST